MEVYSYKPGGRIDDYLASRSRLYRTRIQQRLPGPRNFGDELGPIIVKRLLELHGLDVKFRKSRYNSTLFTVGSVISMVSNGDSVWGSGHLAGDKPALRSGVEKFTTYALRGPLTKLELETGFGIGQLPEVFGDPAVLVPYLFPELRKNQSTKLLQVSHMSESPKLAIRNSHILNLVATESPFTVIREIIESQKLITSSLHAKIIADSFGVPCNVYSFGEMSDFKFRDYAGGVGLHEFAIYATPESALEAEFVVPDFPLELKTSELIDSFPFHLFRP